MNHLEQLVSEWLQYKGYFVRTSVQVGPRAKGGFEGELDIVAFNPKTAHMLHVECSLDALSEVKRQAWFKGKFERGQRYARQVFQGVSLPEDIDYVVVHQFASGSSRDYGGGRLVTVRELTHEIFAGLKGKSPRSGAVPSNLPLLRTMQLAADAASHPESAKGEHHLIDTAPHSN